MTLKPPFLGLAVCVIAASSLAGATAQARQRASATYTIIIDKMTFGPAPSDLHVGDSIVWVNHDFLRHTATAVDGSFDLDLASGKSARMTLARPGKVAFKCKFHPGMKGTLNIVPLRVEDAIYGK